ncbi:MAG: DUF3450 family protein [Phycisphaeraceae bacterium]
MTIFHCGFRIVLVLLFVAFGLAGGEAFGQAADVQAQIAAERAAIERSAARHEEALDQARAERRELASELLELETQRERDARRADELREQVERKREAVAALRAAESEVTAGAVALAEQAAIAVDEQPGTQALRQRLEGLLEGLTGDDTSPAVLIKFAEVMGDVHAQGQQVSLQEADIFNADGQRETVQLLTAGHVAFAYRSVDGSRFAIAMQSPADAAGYRWSERLPEAVVAQLQEAFAQAERSEPVVLPMDVTQELRVEAVAEEEGLAAIVQSGGWVMLPLALVALAALLLTAERAWILYGRNRSDRRLVAEALTAARDHRIDEAEQRVQRGNSVVARTLAACLRRRTVNMHAMEDSIQEQLLHELPRLQRFLGGIAILAAIAPLLGLLGTVTGIIQTFGVIRAFGNANPSLMAGGISEALLTTATGLSIAIPILLLHAVLRGRVDSIVADAEKHAATLLNILSHDGERADAEPRAPVKQSARESALPQESVT